MTSGLSNNPGQSMGLPGNYAFNNGINSAMPSLPDSTGMPSMMPNSPGTPSMPLPNSLLNMQMPPMYNQINNPFMNMNPYGDNRHSYHKYGFADVPYGMPEVAPTINVDNLSNNVMNALRRDDVNAVQSIVLLTIQANIDNIEYENESRVNTSWTVNNDMITQSGLHESVKTVVLTELKRIQTDSISNIQYYVNEAKRSSEMYKTLAQSWVTLTSDVAKNQIMNQIPKIQRAIDHIMNVLEVRITPIADHASEYIDRVTRDSLIKSSAPTQVYNSYLANSMFTATPSYGTNYGNMYGAFANSAYGGTPMSSAYSTTTPPPPYSTSSLPAYSATPNSAYENTYGQTTTSTYNSGTPTTTAYSTPQSSAYGTPSATPTTSTHATYGASTTYPNSNYANAYNTPSSYGSNYVQGQSNYYNPQHSYTGTAATAGTV